MGFVLHVQAEQHSNPTRSRNTVGYIEPNLCATFSYFGLRITKHQCHVVLHGTAVETPHATQEFSRIAPNQGETELKLT